RTVLGLARTALRETFEETGLVLGRPQIAGQAPLAALSPIERAYAANNLRPDFGLLTYIGRAITPTMSPLRFHARFFLGDGREAAGALAANGELEDLRWRPIAPVAGEWISDVTLIMLDHAVAVWNGAAHSVLFYRYVGGKPRVTLR
ncbi:MAG: hypothetical protein JO010_01315, partial [Alphaproteobacteria bacterium]|nr:hypothetical protein [Alphaproteobacteria bacterium]